ncbi:MAG: TlpA disulfide reductase family protein [Cyclobacteriaceae bacterium]
MKLSKLFLATFLCSLVAESCNQTNAEQSDDAKVTFEAINVYNNPNSFQDKVEPLLPGSNPPELKVEKWFNGEPVNSFEKGRVYVVEFFASWCQPCRKSIPHLARLQESFRDDLTVIAVAASESEPNDKKLVRLLDKYKEVLTYKVAYTSDEETFKNWMWGANNTGLPWVFIIDREGKIAWFGQPFFSRFEPVLRSVLNETYKPEIESELAVKTVELRRELWEAQERFWTAFDEENWSSAIAEATILFESGDESFYYESIQLFLIKYKYLDQKGEALEMAAILSGGLVRDIPEGLYFIAEIIADDPTAGKPFDKVALDIATRLNERTDHSNSESLFLLGKLSIKMGLTQVGKKWLKQALKYADNDLTEKIENLLSDMDVSG